MIILSIFFGEKSMINSFQDPEVVKTLKDKITKISHELKENIKICHVCGTHEYTISHWGIRNLLPSNIEVIAGPGCPVCICPSKDIEHCIWLAKQGYILATFGDMARVPCEKGSLLSARAEGADIRVVYSFLDAMKLAKQNPERELVFFSIGFETTAPMVAIELINKSIPRNLSILSSHRLVPPAMELLLNAPEIPLHGFIAPGHVSAITGSKVYEPLSNKYKKSIVIAGFEPVDVLFGILSILYQIKEKNFKTENLYPRVVTREGNKTALEAIKIAYSVIDANWRGIGEVQKSGLEISEKFEEFNIRLKEKLPPVSSVEMPSGCRCAEVILGKIYPDECPLFNRKCTPENPVGPCMVGIEGTCAIHAKYGSNFPLV